MHTQIGNRQVSCFNILRYKMLIAQCNGSRIMTPSVFRFVLYKPHCHDTVPSATEHEISQENEG